MYNADKFTALLNDTVLLKDYIDAPESKFDDGSEVFDDASELEEYLQERISECEVIYYHNAMKLLSERDVSLTESLGLALELGYTADKINSELLATLLLQRELSEELAGLDLSTVFEA